MDGTASEAHWSMVGVSFTGTLGRGAAFVGRNSIQVIVRW